MLDKSSLGPDAEIVTNAAGGKQSATLGRFDLLPATAIMRVAQVLQYGASRYSANNWRKIDMASHINHALQHLFALMSGDTSDDHLGHAACRLMMAVDVETPFDFKACPDDLEPKEWDKMIDHIAQSFADSLHIEDWDGELDAKIAEATTFGRGQTEPEPEPKFSLKNLIGKFAPKPTALTEHGGKNA